LGLTAGGGTISADDLLKPGHLAGTGFEAAWPLLNQASQMLGFTSFFDNFLTIVILLIAWLFVIVAFFILSIQLFVTIIEFKLTTLAGFVLVPFALWNRTAFLAERVLGSVITSGIKVMVLAVIVGIGSGFFGDFVSSLGGQDPDLGAAMSLVLASLALMGLGIFGPAVASGLVAGAPQLGAGAAVGTVSVVFLGLFAAGLVWRARALPIAAAVLAVGGGAAVAGTRAIASGGIGAIRAGTAMGSAASTAYKLGQETSGSSTVGAGLSGVASAAGHAARDRISAATGLGAAAERGERAALLAGARTNASSNPDARAGLDDAPQWARQLRSEAAARHHRHIAMQTVREGDRGGAGATPDIAEKED
jgi:type IV secretion system protein TrbL